MEQRASYSFVKPIQELLQGMVAKAPTSDECFPLCSPLMQSRERSGKQSWRTHVQSTEKNCDLNQPMALLSEICFTGASAQIASQPMFESSFWIEPLLGLLERVLNENTALESCPVHPGSSVGKVSRPTARIWLFDSFGDKKMCPLSE
jgi:hypothetical protein